MMGKEEPLFLRRFHAKSSSPHGLSTVKIRILVCGIEPDDLPVIVLQREVASPCLPREPRLAEQVAEVVEAAGVHVVICVQTPRSDDVLLLREHGPHSVAKEATVVLSLPTAVVDVAQ